VALALPPAERFVQTRVPSHSPDANLTRESPKAQKPANLLLESGSEIAYKADRACPKPRAEPNIPAQDRDR
jgi:hypothetical protein